MYLYFFLCGGLLGTFMDTFFKKSTAKRKRQWRIVESDESAGSEPEENLNPTRGVLLPAEENTIIPQRRDIRNYGKEGGLPSGAFIRQRRSCF